MLICEAVEPNGKTCRACGVFKDMSDFSRNRIMKDGYQSNCRSCAGIAYKKMSLEKPDQVKRYWRTSHLKRKFNLTNEAFEAMWEMQMGLCGMCYKPLPEAKTEANVDHCHTTGKIRSLLHSRCNTGFGLFQEDPAVLRLAAEYAERHSIH